MIEKLLYSDIYEEDFLNNFGENASEIGTLELTEEQGFSIDIYQIAKIMGITIEEEFSVESGSYDSEKRIIKVNAFEAEVRKRFTIAHELGHAVLDHEGVSFRTEIQDRYEDVLLKGREVQANKFASDIIMPKQLILRLMNYMVKQYAWDANSLDSDQVATLIKETARQLKVSEVAMKYAVKNKNIFSNEV